jgi:outer membrane protein OmpA-like peptidoglycan-associated protein
MTSNTDQQNQRLQTLEDQKRKDAQDKRDLEAALLAATDARAAAEAAAEYRKAESDETAKVLKARLVELEQQAKEHDENEKKMVQEHEAMVQSLMDKHQSFGVVEEKEEKKESAAPTAILQHKKSVQMNITSILSHETINYNSGTTLIKQESKSVIEKIAEILKKNPDIEIRIEGHVQLSKKFRKNKAKIEHANKLSDKRAQSVLKYMVKNGIEANRMTTQGYGASCPLPEGQDSKRVEIKVVGLPENDVGKLGNDQEVEITKLELQQVEEKQSLKEQQMMESAEFQEEMAEIQEAMKEMESENQWLEKALETLQADFDKQTAELEKCHHDCEECEKKQESQKKSEAAANTTKQLNERQQALQEQCKLILQGETTTWKYTMNGKLTDMKVNPGDIVKQGDWIGEFTSVTATDQNHLLVVFTSLPDQQFTTNENMSIGDLVNIDADDLLTLASATVKNTIRFVPNTTIIVEECKHIVGKIAGILNNYGEINIRIDGHVKMSKKSRKNPDKMEQARMLSAERAESILQLLASSGITENRMSAKGFGGDFPLPKGQDDKRVEITVLE